MTTSVPQDGPFPAPSLDIRIRVRARSEALERLRQDPIARSDFLAQLDRLHRTGQITHASAQLMQALVMPRCACGAPAQAADERGVHRCPECNSIAATGQPLPDEERAYGAPFAGGAHGYGLTLAALRGTTSRVEVR